MFKLDNILYFVKEHIWTAKFVLRDIKWWSNKDESSHKLLLSKQFLH